MRSFRHRSYQPELLDEDHIPFAAILKNMEELNTINTWLGGHAITIAGFSQLAEHNKSITVCEIGCGGGDNLAAIVKWGRKQGITIHCTGIDLKQECIEVAKNNIELQGSKWIVSDYRDVNFTVKPDILFSSLFCHHFTDEQLIGQLEWMKENCSLGFFINDLHRNRIAYTSIKWLTHFFSSSYLVKNDAPLSVARGFRKNEWERLFETAGITGVTIQWKWAFRHLITWKHA